MQGNAYHKRITSTSTFTQGTPLCEALLQLCRTILEDFKTGYTAKGLTKQELLTVLNNL